MMAIKNIWNEASLQRKYIYYMKWKAFHLLSLHICSIRLCHLEIFRIIFNEAAERTHFARYADFGVMLFRRNYLVAEIRGHSPRSRQD